MATTANSETVAALVEADSLGRLRLRPGALPAALARRGLTVDELARLASVHENTLRRLARGHPARTATLGRLLRALDHAPAFGSAGELIAR